MVPNLDYHDLFILIKDFLGGNIGINFNFISYKTNSFGSARKVINYLDHYHLLSSKYINYFK
jgi:hypothetical protein